MKKILTVFLQVAVVALGIGVLALMLWEPHLEGRNAHATLFQIYFNDPFLAYAYASSVAFFVALYQAFKLLGHIGRNEARSEASLKALRTIKYCAATFAFLVVLPISYLFIVRPDDDIAGGVAVGLFLILVSVVAAVVAAVFERALQSPADSD